MPAKGEYDRFRNYETKIKKPFMIYGDFESILVPEDNGKQNPNRFYVNKYPKHVACIYGYKLVCVDDKFSKSFKSYLGEYSVCNFINGMVEESKYCSGVMKKHFNKNLKMTKKDDEDFSNTSKCWIFGNAYFEGDIKEKDQVKLNHNIPVVFQNLKIMISILLCKN